MALDENKVSIITKVVVGSRLHGLNRPDSDWDFRGIHISPLKSVLSPFTKQKNTVWIEGSEDNTSYELAEFCKLATKGNATILEVFFSDMIEESSPIADTMRENWWRFMDTHHFINASRGYAHNQWNKFYNFETTGVKGQERTAKFAVAFLRVMWQCEQFLLTGQFKCNLEESDLYPLLKKIKPMTREEVQKVLPEIVEAMSAMDMRVAKAEGDAKPEILAMKPDLPWVEDFIYHAYFSMDEINKKAPTTQDYVDAYERGELTAQELQKKINQK